MLGVPSGLHVILIFLTVRMLLFSTFPCPMGPMGLSCSSLIIDASVYLTTTTTNTGQYWGELGYFRLEAGKNSLGIESEVVWATPKSFTVNNFPCNENGDNCRSRVETQFYVDPSNYVETLQKRLRGI